MIGSSEISTEPRPPRPEKERRPERPEPPEDDGFFDLGAELNDLINDAEAETTTQLANAGPDAPQLAPEEFRQVQGELARNAAEMRKAAERAKQDEKDAVIETKFEEAVEIGTDGVRRLDLMVEVCAERPELAASMDVHGFSQSDKLAVGLRIAHEHPDKFMKMLKVADFQLNRDEQIGVLQDIIERNPLHFKMAAEAFKLSSDDIAGVLSQYPAERRKHLFESIRVPEPKSSIGPAPEGTARWYEKVVAKLEKREHGKKMARADAAGRELLLAIERAMPERAAIERERNRIESEMRGPILTKQDLGGSLNNPLAVEIEGRVLPSVYKPHDRERGVKDGHKPAREGIDPGGSVMREWLAYQIDKALQLDVVPATVVREGPEGFGTVQDWKVGTSGVDGKFVRSAKNDPVVREQLARIAFLDVVTQNSDRHGENWNVSPDGRHNAIDNGNIFGKGDKPADKVRSWPLWAVGGRELPSAVKKSIDAFRAAPEIQDALKKAFEAALGSDSGRAWKVFTDKMDQSMSVGLPKDSEWDINPETDGDLQLRKLVE